MRPRNFWLLALLIAFSAPPARSAELKKVTFLPQWLPQAQFAGYYVAREKGIYRQNGLDVTILRGGPDFPSSAMLARKRADFTTLFLSTAIQKRAGGLPLVNIAQVGQRSAFMLVAKKKSWISSAEDLNGRKVSLWQDFELQPLAFFRKYRLQMKIIPQGGTMNLFLRGGVDVVSAMWYNEYHMLLSSGLNDDELTPFFFDRYGLNFPEDGIYCLEETLSKDRGLCRSFALASLEGWRRAFERPEEALGIVMKYVREAQVGTNRTHQKWMLARMKDIILPPARTAPMGLLSEADFFRVAEELKGSGIIRETPSYPQFHVPWAGGGS